MKTDRNKEYYEKNKEVLKAKARERRRLKKTEIAQYRKVYNKENKDKARVYRLEYCKKNKDIISEKKKAYNRKNPKRASAWWAKRYAAKLNRTPPWADLEAIQKFYEACPEGYEVDHIIPLQGKEVSGLHVLENLQYLTREENRQKSNKFTGLL